MDGKAPGENHGVDIDAYGNGTVAAARLYQFVRQAGDVRARTFEIRLPDPGVQAFAVTFGLHSLFGKVFYRNQLKQRSSIMHRAFIFAVALTTSAIAFAAQAAEIKNMVIVHGALADGSGWRKVAEILQQRGFNVTVVQEPITSLKDDVAATNRVLDLQDGPSLLIGHSYGGMVITEAGNHANVAGLVYVAAFEPDKGESLVSLASSKPAAGTSIRETKDGNYLYLDPANFAADFAADLPKEDAAFLSRSQVFASKEAFTSKVTEPAWQTKKSWAIVATQDRSINPDLERDMAKRAGSETIEIEASHAVFASQPDKVADVIAKAAQSAQ